MERLGQEHRRCELLLAAAQSALERGEWSAFKVRLVELRSALIAHFAGEEEEIFPEFERRIALREPTAELRVQHRRMREILDALAAVAPAHDPEGCRSELATLGLLYRQHRESEESLLYPALARALDAAPAPAGPPALDLRGLEPPQPIMRIFEALERDPATPLRVVLRHEPQPLYRLLSEHGFEWSGAHRADGGYELTIRKPQPAIGRN